jgi:hypothetical protein
VYCNWEAVIAHALYLLEKKQLTAEQHERVVEHVHGIVGTVVDPAPHYEQLVHTKGHMSAIDFHRSCAAQTHPVSAVKISPDGQVFELLLYPKEGTFSFEDYLHKPSTFHAPPSTFHSMRKKGQKGDRDLSVWHYAAKDLPLNPTASNFFKMQLHGDVVLVQQSREQAFMPRERFVGFTKQMFDELFNKKRKKPEAPCMSSEQYDEVKLNMQQTLNEYENTAAGSAAPPVSRTATAVPTAGRKLAQLMKERQSGPLLERQSGPLEGPPPQILVA